MSKSKGILKNMNNRIAELDIIKGICIIGIVFGYAEHELLWLSYFFLYDFYFVGDFTYHDKSFMKLLFSKITRIYIPFIISNLFAEVVCIFLHKVTNYGGATQWTQYLLSILKFNLKESVIAPSWMVLYLVYRKSADGNESRTYFYMNLKKLAKILAMRSRKLLSFMFEIFALLHEIETMEKWCLA